MTPSAEGVAAKAVDKNYIGLLRRFLRAGDFVQCAQC
jgi:hypothetical protein